MITISSIEELAAELEEITKGPASSETGSRVLSLMEDWLARSRGAADLVERFGASENPVLVRTLAFLLARSASSRTLNIPIGPLVLRAIELLRSDDESARMNLLSALQLSSMYNDLLAGDQELPGSVMDLLIDCTGRSEGVQATLAAVVAALHGRGLLARAGRERVDSLRSRIREIKPAPGSLLEMEMADLAPFLSSA